MDILDSISKTIIDASTTLSQDKFNALKKSIQTEDNENAKWALEQILENYKVAQNIKFPLCDDTGITHVIIEMGADREISGTLLKCLGAINNLISGNSFFSFENTSITIGFSSP